MTNIENINKEILRLKQLGEKVKDISDGNHTFADLHLQRMHLFSVICSCYPELSWKSKSILMKKMTQCLIDTLLLE